MDKKTETKSRFYFKNGSLNFAISLSQFENILYNFIKENPDWKSHKNGHKLYGYDNKFFKIFQDGSCYGFIVKENKLIENGIFVENQITTQQIYNDDFAGLQKYWVEEVYEEIIFKKDDKTQITFSKMQDSNRDFCQYCINVEGENTNSPILKSIHQQITSSCESSGTSTEIAS